MHKAGRPTQQARAADAKAEGALLDGAHVTPPILVAVSRGLTIVLHTKGAIGYQLPSSTRGHVPYMQLKLVPFLVPDAIVRPTSVIGPQRVPNIARPNTALLLPKGTRHASQISSRQAASVMQAMWSDYYLHHNLPRHSSNMQNWSEKCRHREDDSKPIAALAASNEKKTRCCHLPGRSLGPISVQRRYLSGQMQQRGWITPSLLHALCQK